jgi:microcystin-dependent protein
MADPFVAEIRIFPFNFPPTGWAFCNGQLLPLSQNTALFALLGTMYGGDGKSTFALPDLQGSSPMHPNSGQNGLSPRSIGEIGGSQTVTLLQSEIPAHTHQPQATTGNANTDAPGAAVLGRGNFAYQGTTGQIPLYSNDAPNTAMSLQTMSLAGSSLPHNNMQPYLTLNFCIALQGVFPPRP